MVLPGLDVPVTCLCYADELAVPANSPAALQQLDILQECACAWLGFRFKPPKCATLADATPVLPPEGA